jgi:hypothetical protein
VSQRARSAGKERGRSKSSARLVLPGSERKPKTSSLAIEKLPPAEKGLGQFRARVLDAMRALERGGHPVLLSAVSRSIDSHQRPPHTTPHGNEFRLLVRRCGFTLVDAGPSGDALVSVPADWRPKAALRERKFRSRFLDHLYKFMPQGGLIRVGLALSAFPKRERPPSFSLSKLSGVREVSFGTDRYLDVPALRSRARASSIEA